MILYIVFQMFREQEDLERDVQSPQKTNNRTLQQYQRLTPTHQRTLRNIAVHYTVYHHIILYGIS